MPSLFAYGNHGNMAGTEATLQVRVRAMVAGNDLAMAILRTSREGLLGVLLVVRVAIHGGRRISASKQCEDNKNEVGKGREHGTRNKTETCLQKATPRGFY